jgi:putative FmdB family regulatory protein
VPLYEFQCKKCGHRFERIQKFSDPDPKSCPECGGKIERMLHAPAVQFKGSGWYATDYASKGKSSSKDEGGASSESSSKSDSGEKKSESKEPSKKSPKDKE